MQLADAIQAYLRDRQARGFAKGTLRNQRQTLEGLLVIVGNVNTRNLRPQHIDRYWGTRPDWSPGTINRVRNTLRTFFKWCQTRGYVAKDMELVGGRKLRVAPRDRVIIPQEQFGTYLAGIKDPRTRAANAIGLYLFTRLSEIVALRWQDWNPQTSTIEVFRPKTQTLDTLPVCEELDEELRRWRMIYGARVGEVPRPGWYLIPGIVASKRYGVPGTKGFAPDRQLSTLLPTTQANLAYSMKTALEEAGYYRPYEGGHTLRRSGAIALYHQLASVGHDRAIRMCQAMLGHASISTTEVYLRLDLDRKARNDLLAGRRMFPGGDEEGVVIEMGSDEENAGNI